MRLIPAGIEYGRWPKIHGRWPKKIAVGQKYLVVGQKINPLAEHVANSKA